jgi:hypothetical protein
MVESCFFAGGSVGAGFAVGNFNAVDNSVIGGDFQGCNIGIFVAAGSINTIHGVSFQTSSDTDIAVNNSAGDVYSIVGCRTESANFCRIHAGASTHLAGCSQPTSTSGTFCFMEAGNGGSSGPPGALTIDSCWSKNGIITGNGYVYIRGNPPGAKAFGNTGYLSSFTGAVILQDPQPPNTQTGNYALVNTDTIVIFNNSGGSSTLTLPAATGQQTGRQVMVKTTQNQTVVSASSNVVPLAGGSAGTAILAATAGKWATLVSDGTSWVIMQAN